MPSDSQILEASRVLGLSFDDVYTMFKRSKEVDVNGNTFNNVSVTVVPNWGPNIVVSNVTSTGSIVPPDHAFLDIGDSQLLVSIHGLQRALRAISAGVIPQANNGEDFF